MVVTLLDANRDRVRLTSAATEGGADPVDADQLAITFTLSQPDNPVVVFAVTMDNLVLPEAGRYRLHVDAGRVAETSVGLRVAVG